MKIILKKFGSVLISRPAGKESFLALQTLMKGLKGKEKIEVNFEGVSVLTPSWADEFITPLKIKDKNRVTLINTENPSVVATLETLEKAGRALRNARLPAPEG